MWESGCVAYVGGHKVIANFTFKRRCWVGMGSIMGISKIPEQIPNKGSSMDRGWDTLQPNRFFKLENLPNFKNDAITLFGMGKHRTDPPAAVLLPSDPQQSQA